MCGASNRTKKNRRPVWTRSVSRIKFAIWAYWRMYESEGRDSLIGRPTNVSSKGKVVDLTWHDRALVHLRWNWSANSTLMKRSLIKTYFMCRYKMISKFTWPNFVAGTPKDGTRVLIEECGFENDVKYGRTKVFIRTPHTLFALEKVSIIFVSLEQIVGVSFSSVDTD